MASSLVNLFGFTIGAILYAMLFWMVLRSSSDRLTLLTGLSGLSWNIGAFSGYGLYNVGLVGPSPLLLAISFSALGFLPALVVHSVLRARGVSKPLIGRSILVVAYALSFIAAGLHIASAVLARGSPSQAALMTLTVGFALVMIAILLSTARKTGWAQSLWVVALAVFAVSALHLSNHQGTDPWWLELIGHHSSVPLAIAFLHQDYRFALADIFLKRAVALVLLVSVVVGVYITGLVPLADHRTTFLLLAIWVATALIYPWLRSTAARFVDNVVLRRPDYDKLLVEVTRAVSRRESVEGILEDLEQLLGPALCARSIQWTPISHFELTQGVVRVLAGDTAVAILPTVEAPHYSLSIGALEGGRRWLSDDIAAIERLALLAARRIDAVRAAQERFERNVREREISRLAAEAELRALRAQIHPHFLFNALTTIGYLIQTAPDRALATLLRLSGLLRSVLRSNPEFSSLGEELKIISAYLDIERARFEERLRVKIEVHDDLRNFKVPTLLLQPLVENAVKHGISKSVAGGEVRVTAALVSNTVAPTLRIVVEDTGVGGSDSSFATGRAQGVGLNNLERRLRCYGQDAATLTVQSQPGFGTRVEIVLPVEPSDVGRSGSLSVGAGQS